MVLHALVIDEIGGSHGVRDPHLLESIVRKPQSRFGGKELYRGVFKKAAVLLEATASYHVFVDGNKRTAFTATARFLYVNGYELAVGKRDAEKTVLATVTKAVDIESLERWLKKNSRRIPKRK